MDNWTVLFPGQGSQYVGMGQSLYNQFAIARETFLEAEDILRYALMDMCFSGDMGTLSKTEFAQPAILTVSVAAFRVFQHEFAIEPALVAGHSLGEITALTCSGAIQFADALRIVQRRGQLMQQAVPEGDGAMAAIVGLDSAMVESLCTEYSRDNRVVVLANYNSTLQVVISGHAEKVQQVGEACKRLGASSVINLNVSAPFHSPLMLPAVSLMEEELGRYRYNEPKWPVMSGAHGRLYKGADEIINQLANQLILPVNWQAVMDELSARSTQAAVEIGPRHILKNLARNMPFPVFGFEKLEDVASFRQEVEAAKERLHLRVTHLVDRAIGIIVCTKNRNHMDAEYKQGVLEPYYELQALRASLESHHIQGSHMEVHTSSKLLKQVMNAKKVPIPEQYMRYEQLYRETGFREPILDLEIG